MKTTDQNYKKWDLNYARKWKAFPSPARPSKGEVEIFSKYLDYYRKNNKQKIKVLILGSTPELRDLCYKNNVQVYCIDINKDVYQALTMLVKHKNRGEQFIHANWLDFKYQVKFDCILGDAVNNVLPLKNYNILFKNLYKHLKKSGLLIFRSIIQNQNFMIPPKESFSNFRRYYQFKGINIYTATFNNLALYFLDKKNSEVSINNMFEYLKNLLNIHVVKQSEFNNLLKYYQNVSLKLSIPKNEFLLNSVEKYFKVITKEFGLDYLASLNNPIYIMRPL